jgi:hypothetical protein
MAVLLNQAEQGLGDLGQGLTYRTSESPVDEAGVWIALPILGDVDKYGVVAMIEV